MKNIFLFFLVGVFFSNVTSAAKQKIITSRDPLPILSPRACEIVGSGGSIVGNNGFNIWDPDVQPLDFNLIGCPAYTETDPFKWNWMNSYIAHLMYSGIGSYTIPVGDQLYSSRRAYVIWVYRGSNFPFTTTHLLFGKKPNIPTAEVTSSCAINPTTQLPEAQFHIQATGLDTHSDAHLDFRPSVNGVFQATSLTSVGGVYDGPLQLAPGENTVVFESLQWYNNDYQIGYNHGVYSDTYSTAINVNCARKPVAVVSSPEPEKVVYSTSEAITMLGSGSYSVPAGHPLSYKWEIISGPNGPITGVLPRSEEFFSASLSDFVSGPVAGRYTFSLIVQDEDLESEPTFFHIDYRDFKISESSIFQTIENPNPNGDVDDEGSPFVDLIRGKSLAIRGLLTSSQDITGKQFNAELFYLSNIDPIWTGATSTGASDGEFFLSIPESVLTGLPLGIGGLTIKIISQSNPNSLDKKGMNVDLRNGRAWNIALATGSGVSAPIGDWQPLLREYISELLPVARNSVAVNDAGTEYRWLDGSKEIASNSLWLNYRIQNPINSCSTDRLFVAMPDSFFVDEPFENLYTQNGSKTILIKNDQYFKQNAYSGYGLGLSAGLDQSNGTKAAGYYVKILENGNIWGGNSKKVNELNFMDASIMTGEFASSAFWITKNNYEYFIRSNGGRGLSKSNLSTKNIEFTGVLTQSGFEPTYAISADTCGEPILTENTNERAQLLDKDDNVLYSYPIGQALSKGLVSKEITAPIPVQFQLPFLNEAYKVQIKRGSQVLYSKPIFYQLLKDAMNNLPEDRFTGNPSQQRADLLASVEEIKVKLEAKEWMGANTELTKVFAEKVQNYLNDTAKSDPLEFAKSEVVGLSNDVTTHLLKLTVSEPTRQIFQLRSDRKIYQVGDRANFSAHANYMPSNSSYEYILKGEFDGAPIRIKRINEKEFLAASPRLSEGEHGFTIFTFLQNSRQARGIESQMSQAEVEILKLKRELRKETDPDKIAEILKRISLLDSRVVALDQQLDGLRVRVGPEQSISVIVN